MELPALEAGLLRVSAQLFLQVGDVPLNRCQHLELLMVALMQFLQVPFQQPMELLFSQFSGDTIATISLDQVTERTFVEHGHSSHRGQSGVPLQRLRAGSAIPIRTSSFHSAASSWAIFRWISLAGAISWAPRKIAVSPLEKPADPDDPFP
ncbi:MAG: hypothetical protein ERJ67_10590 [Aphanocapsa feldmannii 277cV]|uniref:Uncharacterized protein n=2 Tax=Aphanocapsa feldmannii TaxID=192050 RepID=A0A524RKT8_9CHRO|nr:MAG: hypothetical protein ERJ67_10590 [Aphanocapsa feldmannii 277cV]TGH27567.1 MAG: hypothetical protein ERJ68_00940 [Aphanocapsa feldmannii 277cI]